MIIEALDGIETDVSVLCSQSNTPQLINATYLQTLTCNHLSVIYETLKT